MTTRDAVGLLYSLIHLESLSDNDSGHTACVNSSDVLYVSVFINVEQQQPCNLLTYLLTYLFIGEANALRTAISFNSRIVKGQDHYHTDTDT